jgi:DNA-binding PadR family transcriptional regulator
VSLPASNTDGWMKRWIRPQAVPRGILRLYVLSMLSKHPETGYSIMRTIEDKTEGAWRPGPGTVYPLLRSLVKEGLLEAGDSAQRGGGSFTYSVTKKGKQQFEEMQRMLTSAGKKERVMIHLFADMLPSTVWASMFVSRQRETFDIFAEKVMQIPQPQRDLILKETKAMMESHMSWLDSKHVSKKAKSAD